MSVYMCTYTHAEVSRLLSQTLDIVQEWDKLCCREPTNTIAHNGKQVALSTALCIQKQLAIDVGVNLE